ncbi:MAG: hypothetical protein ACYCV6_02615 [Steroidobacteraceae bacterium]
MSQSRMTDTPADAAPTAEGRRRYRAVFEMVQVFTEEVEVEADTEGQAQVEAQEMIDADALRNHEFQGLKSTEYRVSTVRSLA